MWPRIIFLLIRNAVDALLYSCIQPPVWTKTANKIRKLKCKAGLSTTLMKSHIKPSRESMCTGGNESEAKPTGVLPPISSPFPLFLHYHYLVCHSPRNFLPFLSLIFFFPIFTGYLYNLTLLAHCFPLSFLLSPHCTSPAPPIFLFPHFPSSSLLPSGCFLLYL